jgi:hypothetical protein
VKEMTLKELQAQLRYDLKRKRLERDEQCRKYGSDSIDFMWTKAVCETLQGVLWQIDPNDPVANEES